MRQNTLDTVFYGVMIPESRYTHNGEGHVTPPRLMSASKTNMPALYMSERVAKNNARRSGEVVPVMIVLAPTPKCG
jgi:hypothetical protein